MNFSLVMLIFTCKSPCTIILYIKYCILYLTILKVRLRCHRIPQQKQNEDRVVVIEAEEIDPSVKICKNLFWRQLWRNIAVVKTVSERPKRNDVFLSYRKQDGGTVRKHGWQGNSMTALFNALTFPFTFVQMHSITLPTHKQGCSFEVYRLPI